MHSLLSVLPGPWLLLGANTTMLLAFPPTPLTPHPLSPAWRSMSSLRGMLISSSTVQGRLTWPLMQNSLVPLLLGRPKPANQSGPRRRMVGDTDTVSTLVTVVGQP